MTVPGGDAERRNRVELLRRGSLGRGVHNAYGLHALRRPLVEDRSGMIVIDVALFEPVVASAGVVDLFAHFAGGKERFVAVAQRGVDVGVMRDDVAGGGGDIAGAFAIAWLRGAFQRHLHVIAHLHGWHRRLVAL